jgi:hypothetical protein
MKRVRFDFGSRYFVVDAPQAEIDEVDWKEEVVILNGSVVYTAGLKYVTISDPPDEE